MKKIIAEIKTNFASEIKKSNNIESLYKIKSNFLNKNGELYQKIISNIKNMSAEEKKEAGILINNTKNFFESEIESAKIKIFKVKQLEENKKNSQNLYLNKRYIEIGSDHPLNLIIQRCNNFFKNMNFSVYNFSEIDNEEYNFEKLNIPEDHISRNNSDTLFLRNHFILRTHCTSFTSYFLKNMYKKADNMKWISYGNVYRRDTHDITHTHQFMQIDGFCIGNYTIGNLKWLLHQFINYIFEKDIEIKFRPSYFPFTSPSIEVDIKCFKCNGKGCNICKHMGWIEILGAGIIHPNVFKLSSINYSNVSGIAFGIGIERLAMIKYNVGDIRNFYDNNLRFLNYFKGN